MTMSTVDRQTVERTNLTTRFWQFFCQSVVRAFYRRVEVQGRENIPATGGVLLCANHANALADALIIQAILPRMIHPLARSGLFRNPMLRPFLSMIQAIPVYRRRDPTEGPDRNAEAFTRVFETFARGGVVLIFPEGQSHSDPKLRPFKTGAARMVLGATDADGTKPALIPVGLNFTNKGRFRSSVFVEIGAPVATQAFAGGATEENVRALTQHLETALTAVTINVDAQEDLDLLKRMERFFAMRHGKYRRRNLAQRFRAMKELADAYQRLRQHEPLIVASLARRLQEFQDLCNYWHIRDYHLTVRYNTNVVARFVTRCALISFIALPFGLWGLINSGIPFALTTVLGNRFARSDDQYDTAKMVIGLVVFSLFWSIQIAFVYNRYSNMATVLYVLSLLPATAALVLLRHQRRAILENFRVFLLFMRRGQLRAYMHEQRELIERELARLVRAAKQAPRPDRRT